MDNENNNQKIIAVCGKGGVGKTSISAMLTKYLCESSTNNILSIDADPATGLSYALGLDVKKTLDDIRIQTIEMVENKENAVKADIINQLDYEMLNSITERDNLAFLAIGRPEKAGCYCKINSLLKDIIKDLSKGFEYVVIDGEAGIEQINRRVFDVITHLIIVADTSLKSRNVAKTIIEVANKSVSYSKCGVIFNRIKDEKDMDSLKKNTEIPIIGFIPEDEVIKDFDMNGKSLFGLIDNPAWQSFKAAIGSFVE